jgi:2',3'-cyclic-nucleotide 2'-phosphodiesterase (5'-nucleotidase family)
MHGRRTVSLLAVLAALAVLVPSAAWAAKPPPPPPVNIQILNVSDWHGQLDPLVVGTSQVGGAAVISAYWQAERAENPNTLTVAGGDDFGATPPLSNFFDDVPAVLAQRLMGVQVGTLGNHNFDRGIDHLQSQIDLAMSTTEVGDPYTYISANLKNVKANLSGVDPIRYFKIAGAKIAVIGITNEEAPELVFPGSFGTIQVSDSAVAANKFAGIARKAGANAVIIITHKGVRTVSPTVTGELIDLANAIQPGLVDVIIGDHTDIEYSGIHNGILVHENRSKGLTYARTSVTVQPGRGGRVAAKDVAFVTPLASAVTPDPAVLAMLQPYRDALAPILNTVIGSSTVFIPRADSCGRPDGRLCESLVGNTVTDAMRLTYGTDFAITNSGGLRADLTCPTTDNPSDFCPPYTPPPYLITRGQNLTVLPFGNVAVTLTVNGAEIKTMLENGVSAMPGANGRFAQVSGLCFTYDISAPVGSRVTAAVRQAADGSCTGPAVDLTAASSYTLAMNDFMSTGGDGYPNVFARVTSRDLMDETLADWVGANSPISPSIQGRIVCTTTGATACPVTTP